jgi:16S rRNA (guanine527-N7)-methyltransferase
MCDFQTTEAKGNDVTPTLEPKIPLCALRGSSANSAVKKLLLLSISSEPRTQYPLQSAIKMHPTRIAELLKPFLGPTTLLPLQLEQISTYIDILLRWNARINLTAIRHPEEIVTRHFGESLFAARHLCPPNGGTGVLARPPERSSELRANDQRPTTHDAVDIGSGAGFPGLPLKIWAPHLQVTLIESSQKKATFLREVIRALTLTNINVFPNRAQAYPTKASIVTLRAVENFAATLPTAANLVAPQGQLVLLIGQAQAPQLPTLAPTFHWPPPIPIPQSQSRILLIGRATS